MEEALAHPYLSAYHDVDDEVGFKVYHLGDVILFMDGQPVHTETFDFSFEVVESIEDMRSKSLSLCAKCIAFYSNSQKK